MPLLEQLNSEFGIASAVKFVGGNGGLTKAVITTPGAVAEVYLHGAHVTHFHPTGQPPVLFMSGKSQFAVGKAIRGGVPICFPWFGNLAGHPEAPAHGFARTSEWLIARMQRRSDGSVTIVLLSNWDLPPDSPWSGLGASYSITVGSSLKMELNVSRKSGQPITVEQALHSYFHVGDVRQVAVTGLANTRYLDKLQANRELTEGEAPVRIAAETDRIYLDTAATCEIADPVLKRKIIISKTGSTATVLWNPWIAKARAMPDFGDDEWPGMLCIETCNVGTSAVKLTAGESHTMTAEISAIAM
jgi:glucose-6-phosphate 1-epimerase